MPIYAGADGVTGFVRLELKVYDLDGVLAAPDDIAVTVTLPDGTTSDQSGNVVTSAPGSYYLDYEPAQVGNYGVYWVTTGVNAGTLEEGFSVDDLTVFPPVSLTEVKAHLNIGADVISSDDELRSFVLAAAAAIESRVGALTRRSVTESHSGGRPAIVLRQPPISVTSVTESGTAVTSDGWSVSSSGVLTRTSGYSASMWLSGFDNVSVTYEAGRTSIPSDLRQAVLELVRHLWSTQRGAQRGPRSGDDFVAGQGYSLPNRVLELIAPYEAPGIA